MSLINNSIKVFKILKLFGFAPFTIENGKSLTKPLDVLSFLTSISIGVFIVFTSLKYREDLVTEVSKVGDIGKLVTYIGACSSAVISLILLFFFRHKIWKIILELAKVDELFKEIGISYNDARKVRNLISGLFAFIILTVPVSYVFYKLDRSVIKLAIYMYSGTYLLLGVGNVIGFVKTVHHRLITVNEICKLLVENESNIKIVKSRRNDIEVIGKLMQAYAKLMEIIDSICLCHSIQAMLAMSLVFFYSIFSLFIASKNLSELGQLDRYSIASLMLSAYLMTFMFVEVFVCIQMENEAHNILKTSRNVMKRTNDELKITMMTSFTFMVKRKIPKFSCGLFDFDWKLIYAVSNYKRIFFKDNFIQFGNLITDDSFRINLFCYLDSIRNSFKYKKTNKLKEK
jgi:7tm Chemosensory receptor